MKASVAFVFALLLLGITPLISLDADPAAENDLALQGLVQLFRRDLPRLDQHLSQFDRYSHRYAS